jgi:hypothetical protein
MSPIRRPSRRLRPRSWRVSRAQRAGQQCRDHAFEEIGTARDLADAQAMITTNLLARSA